MLKKITKIYAITANKTLDLELIEKVISKHKIKILQYRHKTINQNTRRNEAQKLRQFCLKRRILFIINDDITLAKKINADGVHLGKSDPNIKQARTLLGERAIIGVSCYDNIKLAIYAQKEGADYVAFGSLFASKTKRDAVKCSLSVIKKAKKILKIPIVCIGGIDFDNKQQAFAAGCDSVAMISALFDTV